jgi:hypothetical protein
MVLSRKIWDYLPRVAFDLEQNQIRSRPVVIEIQLAKVNIP